ncbi:Short chain dehydrogenase [Globisporangium polare]
MTATAAKTVLVTGATRGIGLKFAELYGKLGWNVIGAARDLTVADQLRALKPYKIVQLDTADEASIVSAAKELEGEAIDLLVNNAGILSGGTFTETKEDMMKQFEVNAVGPFLVTRAFLPHLKAAVSSHGSASVVQMASSMGSITLNNGKWHGCFGYRASKAALHMTNASLAHELKPDGIAAFALHPGWVATDISGGLGDIDPQTSVTGLTRVIETLTMAESGKFYDNNGDSMPW